MIVSVRNKKRRYPMRMGTIDPSNFNTTKYPGVCKATNKATFDEFAFLQQQINRVSKMRGLPLIPVDGLIGPGTIAALVSIGGTNAGQTCSEIAEEADVYGESTRAMADALQAPVSVESPMPASPPSYINPATNQEIYASVGGMFGGIPTPLVVAIGVAVLGAGYLLLSSLATPSSAKGNPSNRSRRRKRNPHQYWRRRRSR